MVSDTIFGGFHNFLALYNLVRACGRAGGRACGRAGGLGDEVGGLIACQDGQVD